MNRQTTYFLQKVLTGLATSVIYAAFDYYRYNHLANTGYNSYNSYNRNNQKNRSRKKNNVEFDYIETNYNRDNRYTQKK